ncbi:hypothetical protein Hdeb2414_s0009g00309731 [Helianthus debilis subsp. tardiflorus]
MLSDPILGSTWDGDQLGVLPGYITANFQPGWAILPSNPGST